MFDPEALNYSWQFKVNKFDIRKVVNSEQLLRGAAEGAPGIQEMNIFNMFPHRKY